jgi:TRAP-type C4-dicarboxylate transport system permease large subunit
MAYLFRYREISLQANARYLDPLAAVDDPTAGKQALQRLAVPIARAFGMDRIWFGLITVIVVEIGSLTPPLGL